VNTVNA